MIQKFDPNSASTSEGVFGLPFTEALSKIVLLPVPWEATTSYGGGTSKGPEAILQASYQVDLFDADLGHFYESGIMMQKENPKIKSLNKKAKAHAQKIIKKGGVIKSKADQRSLNQVNELSATLNDWVYRETKKQISKGKVVGLVGGDHSTPLGAIKATLEAHPEMGVLHIDAHADLRNAYEGFKYSHASIMYNVLQETKLHSLVQVGIRDFCEQEKEVIDSSPLRVHTFFDAKLKNSLYQGQTWDTLCNDILAKLPKEVYISFDIDGLDPRFCPSTGTPVPGGLEFDQVVYLLKKLVGSRRKIVGFDLNEVAPGKTEWDANVGARMLFKLCGWTLKSLKGTQGL